MFFSFYIPIVEVDGNRERVEYVVSVEFHSMLFSESSYIFFNSEVYLKPWWSI